MRGAGKAVAAEIGIGQLNLALTFIECDLVPGKLQGGFHRQAAKKAQCNQTCIGIGIRTQPPENILPLRQGHRKPYLIFIDL